MLAGAMQAQQGSSMLDTLAFSAAPRSWCLVRIEPCLLCASWPCDIGIAQACMHSAYARRRHVCLLSEGADLVLSMRVSQSETQALMGVEVAQPNTIIDSPTSDNLGASRQNTGCMPLGLSARVYLWRERCWRDSEYCPASLLFVCL